MYGVNVQYMHIYLNIFPDISVHCSLHSFPQNTITGMFSSEKAKRCLSILEKFMKVANYAVLNITSVGWLLGAPAGEGKIEAGSLILKPEIQRTQKTNAHLCDLTFLSQISKAGNDT